MGENGEFRFKSIFNLEKYSIFSYFSDATLLTEDGSTFDIHRIILASKSLYFQTLFCGMSKDKQEFLIPGISSKCLSDVLCYIYTDDISLVKGNVPELLIASDYLLLNDLYNKIREGIKSDITMDNCLKLLLSAEQINDVDIFRESFRFIEIHFEAIVSRQKYELGSLPMKLFKRLLSSMSLNISSEKTVWRSIVCWVQADVSGERLCHLPDLLTCLAQEELDETIATDILEHNIVAHNSHFNTLESDENIANNRAYIRKFIAETSGPRVSVREYRVPPKLHLVAEFSKNLAGVRLYITYDENLDLWREIKDIDFIPFHLLTIGFNVYTFDCLGRKFLSIDLRTKELVQVTNNRRERFHSCVVVLEGLIYLFSEIYHAMFYKTCEVEIYDPVTNSWSDGIALPNITAVQAVSVRKSIYVVGFIENPNEMAAYAYRPESQTWTPIPAPKVFRFEFLFFEHHSKLFVVGGGENLRNVEVFDLDSEEWRRLDDLPFEYTTLHSTRLNETLFVYDSYYEINSNILRWNDKLQKWEKMKINPTLVADRRQIEAKYHIFCTVDCTETIRYMSKENRQHSTCFEKSHFDMQNTFNREWFIDRKESET